MKRETAELAADAVFAVMLQTGNIRATLTQWSDQEREEMREECIKAVEAIEVPEE